MSDNGLETKIEEWKKSIVENAIPAKGCGKCDGFGNVYNHETERIDMDSCQECEQERVAARMDRHGFKTGNRLIDEEFIAELFKDGRVSKGVMELSKQQPRPMLISGNTGLGKTMLLKCWFNKLMIQQLGHDSGIWFYTERRLCDIFVDETESEVMRRRMSRISPKYIFLDEFFEPANWMDRYSNRHYANVKHAGLWEFIDYVYDSGATVIIATNTDIETYKFPNGRPFFDLSDVHDRKIVRRVYEMCGKKWER